MSRGSTPRHAQTARDLGWLCNLMLKRRGISRSSSLLGLDSRQSNNRKVVFVVNRCFTSLFGTKGLLRDIVIQ